MDDQGIKSALRMIGFVAAILMWAASIYFSVDGFNITVPHMMWVGVLLGFVITAIELVWNEEGVRTNFTLKVCGVLCYAYGIYTNVAGIAHAQGLGSVSGGPELYLFPAILGIFLEVTPEPLAIWALSESARHGDFLGNLFSGVQGRMGSQQRGPMNQPSRGDLAREQYERRSQQGEPPRPSDNHRRQVPSQRSQPHR